MAVRRSGAAEMFKENSWSVTGFSGGDFCWIFFFYCVLKCGKCMELWDVCGQDLGHRAGWELEGFSEGSHDHGLGQRWDHGRFMGESWEDIDI